MRPSLGLLQHACRITLFTRSNCSLCDNAKLVLSKVWERKPFEYREVDVMAPDADKWRHLYEFDTPVIHVESASEPAGSGRQTADLRKAMHRFTEQHVEQLMEMAEKTE